MVSLNQYISNGPSLGQNEEEELLILRDKFPYFQAIHFLIAKSHKNRNTFGFNKSLKKASLYAGDRTLLHKFINDFSEFETKIKNTEQAAEPNLVSEKSEFKETNILKEEILSTESAINLDQNSDRTSEENQRYGEHIFELVRPPAVLDEEQLQEKNIEALYLIENIETKIEPASEIKLAVESDVEPLSKNLLEHTEIMNPEVMLEAIHLEEVELKDEFYIADEKTEEDKPLLIKSEVEDLVENGKEEDLEVKPETELIIEQPIIEDSVENINLENPGPPKELDFCGWLDNFSAEKTNDIIQEKISPIIEDKPDIDHSIEVNSIEVSTITFEVDDEMEDYSEEATMSEEEEKLIYDPAGWAEIAYDIQAFLKQPEKQPETNLQTKKPSKEEIDDLLDRFISKNPSISRKKTEFFNAENMARKSESFHAEVVSETLAALFYKQGLLHQSLEIYEKLMLQNPDKKEIFAARINSIKEELINRL